MSLRPLVRIIGWVLSAAVAFSLSANSFAQSTGTLWGRVLDPDGGVIRDVLITLRSRSIGYGRTTKTDHGGLYQISALAAGSYQVEVRATGFHAQVIDEIGINVGQTSVHDFQLEIGNLAQEVSVTVVAPFVDTATTSVGRVVDQAAVRYLPLNGRNFLELAQLEPAVKVDPEPIPDRWPTTIRG